MKCQQGNLYRAESEVDPSVHFESIEDAECWINGVCETWWFRDNFPNVFRFQVSARDRRHNDSVGGYVSLDQVVVVNMHKTHLNGLIVCHEASHGLTEARYGHGAHSPWFARIYLELVVLTLGPKTYVELRDAFDRHDVDYDIGPESTHALRGSIPL